MQDFRKLHVWTDSHKLVLVIYDISKRLPVEERYALSSQCRRSAASIPTNIAEGCGTFTEKEHARYFQIAFGSACELQYQLILMKDLGYISAKEFQDLEGQVVSIKKRLASLLRTVRKSISKKSPH